jgi:RNA polymerase sigma factor (sigma-70 family)
MTRDNLKIYNQYRSLVWSMILKYGIKGQDQEDIFMESWRAIFSALDSFEGRSKFPTWIARITKYKIMDYIRGRRLIPMEERELSRVIAGEAPEATPSTAISRKREDQREKAIRSEASEIIRATLEKLSPEMRFIVEKWMIGLKYREIAELLNAGSNDPVDTNYVGKQLFQAKNTLRIILARQGIKKIQNLWE